MKGTLLFFGLFYFLCSPSFAGPHQIAKKQKAKVQLVTDIPGGVSKKIKSASLKLLKTAVADAKHRAVADSVYHARTWVAYNSPISGNAQVLVEIRGIIATDKRKGKPVFRSYTVEYRADHDIFRVFYGSNDPNGSVKYNESHWPGYMYNDKAPGKDQINRDITLVMDKLSATNVRLDNTVAGK